MWSDEGGSAPGGIQVVVGVLVFLAGAMVLGRLDHADGAGVVLCLIGFVTTLTGVLRGGPRR